MDNDVRPVKRPTQSLRASIDARNQTTPTPADPTFQTPDEVAASDDIEQPATLVEQVNTELPADASKPKQPPTSWKTKLKLSWPPGKKEWIVLGVALLLIGGGLTWALTHHTKPVVRAVAVKAKPKAPPQPTTVPSNLTGLPVNPAVNEGPITGVMIENSLAARPQSGLSNAGVVFEAIAEGGVTRFLALFDNQGPNSLGPVRSARPYYVQWAMGFDAGYAHVGGSPDALADIRSWGVKDLDQFANGGSYTRISSRDAPHNVYTSMTALNELEAKKGYGKSNFTGFVRKAKEQAAKPPTARSIDFTMSGPLYNVHYDYNPTFNSYNRSVGGQPHLDANTGKMLSPKVVIAIVLNLSQGELDASGAYYSTYQTTGSGTVYVFQDGTEIAGSWTKVDSKSQITFADSSGKPLPLNPGQTWITAVSDTSKVSSAP